MIGWQEWGPRSYEVDPRGRCEAGEEDVRLVGEEAKSIATLSELSSLPMQRAH